MWRNNQTFLQPNATILNLAAKIKSSKIKTMHYIMGMEEVVRDALINKIVRISF